MKMWLFILLLSLITIYRCSTSNPTGNGGTGEDIIVISPNGGENWEIGSSYDITWTASNVNTFNLKYSIDNGTNWIYIVDSISDTTYNWTILNPQSSQCLVRIVSSTNSSISDSSDSVFNIEIGSLTPIETVFVQGGTYDMGDHYNEGYPDELPVHSVILSSFYIGKYEVTQLQYEEVMGTNPADNYGVGDSYPVYHVSWYDAVEFCNALSIANGYTPCYTINETNVTCNFGVNGWRLPTEAEWEYAARGGVNWTDDYRYSGCHDSSDLPDYAWYCINCEDGMNEVGTKLPNQLNIYDMSGNVSEWCNDWYGSDYYENSPTNNPTGPSTGDDWVIRGGCWIDIQNHMRCSARSYFHWSWCHGGFRLCRREG